MPLLKKFRMLENSLALLELSTKDEQFKIYQTWTHSKLAD